MKVGWIVALACGLLAVVLGAVATQVGWATAEESSETTEYHAFSAAVDGPGRTQLHLKWSEPFLDGRDGIDHMRAAGPLLVVGLVFLVLGLVAAEHALWFQPKGAAGAAVVANGIGVALTLVAVVLLPLGMQANLDWEMMRRVTEAGTQLDWGGGLVVGIMSAVLGLAAFGMSLWAALLPSERS